MNKKILNIFDNYQKARNEFVHSIANLCVRPQNIEYLQKSGIMSLLRPLLLDKIPSIQQTAALCLGRLASYSYAMANDIVNFEILPQLIYSLTEQDKYYKKSASFVIKSVAKHNSHLAQSLVDSNAISSLVSCLEEFDNSVKINACLAWSSIAKHNESLAKEVVESGAVPLIIHCLEESDINLKKFASCALSDICKHSDDLAQKVVEYSAIPNLAILIKEERDTHLKRQICKCWAHIAKHSQELAQEIVANRIFPMVFSLLKDPDLIVKKNAATLIREIAKHNHDLADIICNEGGSIALIEYINETKGNSKLPGIITLGFIAGYNENNSMAIIESNGIPPLLDAILNESEDYIQSAAAWTLGKLGGHSYQHSQSMINNNVIIHLLALYKLNETSDDWKKKVKKSLKSIISKNTEIETLDYLIKESPDEILFYILVQFNKIFTKNKEKVNILIKNGGLKEIQKRLTNSNDKLRKVIEDINKFYSNEIIKSFSPNYEEYWLEKLGKHNE